MVTLSRQCCGACPALCIFNYQWLLLREGTCRSCATRGMKTKIWINYRPSVAEPARAGTFWPEPVWRSGSDEKEKNPNAFSFFVPAVIKGKFLFKKSQTLNEFFPVRRVGCCSKLVKNKHAVLAVFTVYDWWGYCQALCDEKFSRMEGNDRQFCYIELCNSVIS